MGQKRRISERTVKLMRLLLAVIGAFLVLDTILIAFRSNFNLGVILPAFFGLPLIALAILLPHMDYGFLCFLKWFTAGCYAAALLIFAVCGTLMVSACKRSDTVKADAVIVLGAAVHGERVTWVLQNRLDTALEWLRQNPEAVVVVSGGQGSGEDISEAEAMGRYLAAAGIAEERIIREDRSVNTSENFSFSKALTDERLGANARLAFVTTGFHVFRAGRVAAKLGIDAVGIPAPDVWYLAMNNFMRESVGICVYALRGQL